MSNRENIDWEPGEKAVADLAPLAGQYQQVHEFAVSPDGERVAVPVVEQPGNARVWVNGQLWETEFERAWGLRFLPDGRLFALVRLDDMWSVAVDGEKWEDDYDFAWNPKFSADGGVVAVQVKQGMEYTLVANGRAWERKFISMRDFALSPDGKRIAAAVQVEPLPEADIFKFVEGTWSVTLNVHDAPGPRLPSRKLREDVPVS